MSHEGTGAGADGAVEKHQQVCARTAGAAGTSSDSAPRGTWLGAFPRAGAEHSWRPAEGTALEPTTQTAASPARPVLRLQPGPRVVSGGAGLPPRRAGAAKSSP